MLADHKFTLPEPFSGRGTFRVTNNGPAEHEAQLVKLTGTLEQYEKFLQRPQGPPPGGEPQPIGGSSAISPRKFAYITLDLKPGVYAFVCFMPDRKTRKSHFELGMVKPFEVPG